MLDEKTNGLVMPKAGDGGPHICKACGYHFMHSGNRLIFDIFKNPFVKCPKCGSLRTKIDSEVRY